jgi:hypothetical protein
MVDGSRDPQSATSSEARLSFLRRASFCQLPFKRLALT